jgi:hypothetical protein
MSAPTPPADPDLDRRRQAFDAAFQRMQANAPQAYVDDDLGNLLHQLYKLGEPCQLRLGKQAFATN